MSWIVRFFGFLEEIRAGRGRASPKIHATASAQSSNVSNYVSPDVLRTYVALWWDGVEAPCVSQGACDKVVRI